MNFLFKKVPRRSPIRDLMVDMALVYGNVGWFTDTSPECPYAYLEEVVKAFIRGTNDPNSFKDTKQRLESADLVSYHHHIIHERKSTSEPMPASKNEARSRRASTAWETYGKEKNLKIPGT